MYMIKIFEIGVVVQKLYPNNNQYFGI